MSQQCNGLAGLKIDNRTLVLTKTILPTPHSDREWYVDSHIDARYNQTVPENAVVLATTSQRYSRAT
jgi:hypothetical protein